MCMPQRAVHLPLVISLKYLHEQLNGQFHSACNLCPACAGNPNTGCMCADAAATLQHASSICDGQGSCVLLAAPWGTAPLTDDLCSDFGGCDFICPNATGKCDGPGAEAALSFR